MASAVKLSREFVETARREAKLQQRSMTQQIEHWARLGRAIERTGALDSQAVRAALAGEIPHEDLTPTERASVLGALEVLVHQPEGNAELAAELAGGPPTSSVIEGELVLEHDDHSTEPLDIDGYDPSP
jgi:hypothetical protein